MTTPRGEAILLLVDAIVDLPVEREEPLELKLVQFSHGNVADFGPRFVLESVIIQELASKKQSHCQHSIDLTAVGLKDAL